MPQISKYRIRRSNGPKPGYKLVHIYVDGSTWSDKNHYDTFDIAVASAMYRLRRNALDAVMDQANLTGEYEGILADHVNGDTLAAKRRTIATAAKARNMKIDIALDHDCGNPREYHFYVSKVGVRQ